MYNKEQLRKELEDCWKAGCNAMLYDLGHTATNHPNRDTYIKSRLAALDDGNYDCQSCGNIINTDYVLPDEIWKQICPKPYDGKGSGGLLCGNCIIKKLCLLVDDGQEGKGLDSKKILQNTLNGAWEEIRRLRALLETDSTGNELLRSIYQICERKGENTNWEAITKKIQERLAALPVADGEGEKCPHCGAPIKDPSYGFMKLHDVDECKLAKQSD